MTTSGKSRILRHGTTRNRAESILRNGPNLKFKEPGGLDTANGFSTAPEKGPFYMGAPEDYASGKAMLFPDEGGPVILELEIPEEIVQRAVRTAGDIRFMPGWGLDELLDVWADIPKRILAWSN